MDWDRLKQFLDGQPLGLARPNIIQFIESTDDVNWLTITQVSSSNSKEEPLIQLADLFAGIGRFSRETSQTCLRWLEAEGRKNQLPLLEPILEVETNRAEQNRFKLIGNLHSLCKQRRLGVSLSYRGYLWTPRPGNPINFWHYQPQHENDRAPVRVRD